MGDPDPRLVAARAQADSTLLDALGASRYMHAMALMRELETLVEHVDPVPEAEALTAFSSLVALRYAQRRLDGQ
jgi:hypothetical protein